MNGKLFQLTATRRWLHDVLDNIMAKMGFQLTATRRWLPTSAKYYKARAEFQLTATRRWLREYKFNAR